MIAYFFVKSFFRDFESVSEISFSLVFLIFPYGPIMFFDVRGEVVRSIVLGHEIDVRNGSGVDRRQKGIFAGVTDGCWRKSNHEISVVRSLSEQIFFGQIPIKILTSIDHSGIALERN